VKCFAQVKSGFDLLRFKFSPSTVHFFEFDFIFTYREDFAEKLPCFALIERRYFCSIKRRSKSPVAGYSSLNRV